MYKMYRNAQNSLGIIQQTSNQYLSEKQCCKFVVLWTFGIGTSTIVFNKLGNYWELSYFPTNLQLLNINFFLCSGPTGQQWKYVNSNNNLITLVKCIPLTKGAFLCTWT